MVENQKWSSKVNVLLQVFLAFIICLFITINLKPKSNTYLLIDGIIFFLIYYILSIKRFKIILEIKKLPIDLVPFMFLAVVIVFLCVRKVNIGLNTNITFSMELETLIYSLIWICVGLFVCIKFKFITFNGWKINIPQAILIILVLLYIALSEEIYFRGLILNYLTQFTGNKIILATFISILVFGISHITNGGWPMVMMSTLAAIFISIAYIRTSNILCATFVHVSGNILWMLFFKTNEKLLPQENYRNIIKIEI